MHLTFNSQHIKTHIMLGIFAISLTKFDRNSGKHS